MTTPTSEEDIETVKDGKPSYQYYGCCRGRMLVCQLSHGYNFFGCFGH